jgi:hypothetical protein
MGIGFYKKKVGALDDHDLPTEPLPLLIPTLPTEILPGQVQPFDYAGTPMPAQFGSLLPANTPGYPIVASTPVATGSYIGTQNEPAQRTGWQVVSLIPFWLIPFGVGMCFVSIQILLLLRFACKLCNLATTIPWVSLVYELSEIVLLPLYALLPPLTQAIFTRIEPYTILAIVLYGLCSRMIVHLLKVLLYLHGRGNRSKALVQA